MKTVRAGEVVKMLLLMAPVITLDCVLSCTPCRA